ncbi:DUF2267 domain-containing protein [Pontibacter sp. Tf4]|uniref:DUF2267 domain-containing protein n=1 Tax=Pontibacter sp. Tf4 TaxID=2761620 RepID=UPI001629EBB7|nr:DUF2267 domain-containing protein [Pontibacter sp. Tf4]MBB6612882.1 DUF2267 domain-containing protein [Pontibacter sp. Tf4]
MAFIFEDNKKDAIVLLQAVAQELRTEDMNKAGRITRAVLHAIRDRLPVTEAVHFAAQLPIIWKGIYFDQYDPEAVPVRIRNTEDWVNYIRNKNAFAANHDFQQDDEVIESFRGVFNGLQRCISDGQLQKVRESLNEEIQDLLEV